MHRHVCSAVRCECVYQLNSIASALLSTREYYIYIHTIYNSPLTLFSVLSSKKKKTHELREIGENLSAKLRF